MQTYSLDVSYDGKPFSGFAKQPGQLTVQGEIENALSLLFRRDIATVCAGRTDAGVHAKGQVVSFDLEEGELRGRSLESIRSSMCALTCDGISISSVVERPRGFSARFDAKSRHYRYFICNRKTPPLFASHFSWFIDKDLDLNAMQEGSKYLIGEHDFKSFCTAASSKGRRTFRNVSEISFSHEKVMDEDLIAIDVIGNAFLHSMIRVIVGSLVDVGLGKRDPEWIGEVLSAKDRKAAGQTAPAEGLVFWEVLY